MSHRVRVSVQQLNLMLRALEEEAILDIMLKPEQIAQVTLRMPRDPEHAEQLVELLRMVLQEPESDRMIHSMVL